MEGRGRQSSNRRPRTDPSIERDCTGTSGSVPCSYLVIGWALPAEVDAQPKSLVQIESDDLGRGVRQRHRYGQLQPFGDEQRDQTGHDQPPATVGSGFQDASQMAFQIRSSLQMADASLSAGRRRVGLCKGVLSPAVLACGTDHPNHVSLQEEQVACPTWRSEMASTGQTLMQLPQRMQLSLSIQI